MEMEDLNLTDQKEKEVAFQKLFQINGCSHISNRHNSLANKNKMKITNSLKLNFKRYAADWSLKGFVTPI